MKQEEIDKGNVLIADFVGWTIKDKRCKSDIRIDVPLELQKLTYDENICEFFYDNKLYFHSDWNWLMLVVEKIELSNIIEIFFMECGIRKYQGTIGNHNPYIILVQGNTKIEAVWLACVEFIEQYNRNK